MLPVLMAGLGAAENPVGILGGALLWVMAVAAPSWLARTPFSITREPRDPGAGRALLIAVW